ncbi:MAG: hypothetical protein QM650_08875 [Microlunatus sp.]
MTWRLVTEFLASLGYGVLSSIVPVFNAEVFLLATQTLGVTAELTAALGAAVGQTIGKVMLLFALRHGTRVPFLQRQLDRARARAADRAEGKHPGRARLAYRRWSERLLWLIGHSHWGPLIVFLSAATGMPPLLAVQFIVPATKMPAWVYAVTVLVGRSILFLAIAFGASAIVTSLWP